MKLDEPLFPMSVAAEAAMLNPVTLKMWYQRGAIKIGFGDRDGGGRGKARRLCFRTVLRIACAAALVRTGVDVADALAGAAAWVNFGSTSNDDFDRDPAELFPGRSLTILIYHGPHHALVVPAKLREEVALRFYDLFPLGLEVAKAPLVLPLDAIYKRAHVVCSAFMNEIPTDDVRGAIG